MTREDKNDPHEPAFGDPRAVVVRFFIASELDGARADVALVWKVKRLSRTRAQDIIRRGDFRLASGELLKPSSRVFEATEVALWRIPPDEPDPGASVPAVIFEDDDLLVVDKPPDLAVHPSARYLHQTLTAWLRARAVDDRIAHPCHRLDRETSGVLVCAKTQAAERTVKRAFMEGTVTKAYLAVVPGVVDADFVVKKPLALQGERGLVRIRMVDDVLGQEAETAFSPVVVDKSVDRTLLACFPRTGRQHQIRAHLFTAGMPIIGDKLYAMGDTWFDAYTRGDANLDELLHTRHALHAASLRLDDGRVFRAPLPHDLRMLLPRFDDEAWREIDARVIALSTPPKAS
jgi:23S rRNA pseudouridine1911/1915/1917 synthase